MKNRWLSIHILFQNIIASLDSWVDTFNHLLNILNSYWQREKFVPVIERSFNLLQFYYISMSNSKLPSSYKDPKIFNNKYIVKSQISSGSFGVVYLAFDKVTKEELAIKLEKEDDDVCTLEREVIILNRIDGVDGTPKLYWSGFEQDYNVMVL